MPGSLPYGGEEFNPGPETRIHCSELLCNEILLKYKKEKASDIDIRRGQKECPLASVSNGVIYFLISYYNESKERLKFVQVLPDPLPQFGEGNGTPLQYSCLENPVDRGAW